MTDRHSIRIDLYQAADGWRWRLWSSSDIIADSSQGYTDQDQAARMAQTATGFNVAGCIEAARATGSTNAYRPGSLPGTIIRAQLRIES